MLDLSSINGGGWGYLLAGWLFLLSQVRWVEGDLAAFNFPASVGVVMGIIDVFVGLNGVMGQASCLYGDWREHVHVGGSTTGPSDLVRSVTLLHHVSQLVKDLLVVFCPRFLLRCNLLLRFELLGMKALCNSLDLDLGVFVVANLKNQVIVVVVAQK